MADNQRPDSFALAWEEFERDMVGSFSPPPDANMMTLIRLSYYFGSHTTLGIVAEIRKSARTQQNADDALAELHDGVSSFIDRHAKATN